MEIQEFIKRLSGKQHLVRGQDGFVVDWEDVEKLAQETQQEERMEELGKKAIRRYIEDCDWDEVIETLHEEELEEYKKLKESLN